MGAALRPDRVASAHRHRRVDGGPQQLRSRSRLRIDDWRVRTKLGVVLIIPALAFLLVAGVQIRTLVDEAAVLGDYASEVGFGQQVAAVVHDLQAERDRTAGELAIFEASGAPGAPGNLSAAIRDQRAAVDREVTALRERAAALGPGPEGWRTAYEQAIGRLDRLPSVREGVGSGKLPRRMAQDVYGRTIESLLALLAAPTPGAEHADLRRALTGYVELARTKEIGSQLRAHIFAVAAGGAFGPGDYPEIIDLRAQRLAALVRFRGAASVDQVDRYDGLVAGQAADLADRLEQAVVDTSGRSAPRMAATGWWKSSTAQQDKMREVERELLTAAGAGADDRSAGQRRRTLLLAGAILVSLLVALAVSIAVGRSMARSLRALRFDALQVAQRELPQVLEQLRDIGRPDPRIEVHPPTVRSRDEIGEVADAFADVHRSAVKLAVEQAVMRRNVNTMFVNLARRSQVLVERQLELLDEMEREERDPDLLGNLFQLDHLAARMRRNDESLLVLAGNEGTRRWRTPVGLPAVVLAAVAEIEQYKRVRHDATDAVHIAGQAVADLVHLLAELLENATTFSPPDTYVRISAYEHSGRTAIIEIADEGMGMSPGALEEANALLASPPAADVAASERMGLFVVSHLAARHGVRVRLQPADRGLVASVWLPPSLLAPAPVVEPPAAPAAAVSAAEIPATLTPELPAAPAVTRARPANGRAPALPVPPPMHVSLTLALPPAPVSPAVEAQPPPDVPVVAAPWSPPDVEDGLGPAAPPDPRTPAPTATGRLRRGPADAGAPSAWWSRSAAVTAPPLAPGPASPPSVPITGGTTARGLPVRVPMAQLTQAHPEQARPAPAVPAQRAEPDPETVGSLLASFYGGVRRAEAEE